MSPGFTADDFCDSSDLFLSHLPLPFDAKQHMQISLTILHRFAVDFVYTAVAHMYLDATTDTQMTGGNPLVNRRFFLIDNCHVTNYSSPMIKTFADKETQQLFIVGKSRCLPSDLIKRAIRRLEYIHYASNLNDLLVPPSNRLHALKGARNGQYSISINDQWRICFRFVEGDAFDVEITDYH